MEPPLERLKAAFADRYALERELGRGGMATVYLAQDLKLKRKVAIKVFSPEVAAAIGPDRFLREIEILAHLNHPRIVTLIDSGTALGARCEVRGARCVGQCAPSMRALRRGGVGFQKTK